MPSGRPAHGDRSPVLPFTDLIAREHVPVHGRGRPAGLRADHFAALAALARPSPCGGRDRLARRGRDRAASGGDPGQRGAQRAYAERLLDEAERLRGGLRHLVLHARLRRALADGDAPPPQRAAAPAVEGHWPLRGDGRLRGGARLVAAVAARPRGTL